MKYNLQTIDFKSIQEMPETERPREKIEARGPLALSDLELICLILGSGVKNYPVQFIAGEILDIISQKKGDITFDDLLCVNGLGKAKASLICASLELGRRLGSGIKKHISDSKEVWQQIRHYGDRDQEHFLCITLNGALEVIDVHVVTIGLCNKTLVHPREIFSRAIKLNATAIIIAHNHPSGNLEPSSDDLEVTRAVINAGNILGIKLLDHIIFSYDNYRSLKETGEFWC